MLQEANPPPGTLCRCPCKAAAPGWGEVPGEKKEDEICTSSLSSSTIPLTSGIEEAPQLLLSVIPLYHIFVGARKPLPLSPFGAPVDLVTDGSPFSRGAVVKELSGTTFRSD